MKLISKQAVIKAVAVAFLYLTFIYPITAPREAHLNIKEGDQVKDQFIGKAHFDYMTLFIIANGVFHVLCCLFIGRWSLLDIPYVAMIISGHKLRVLAYEALGEYFTYVVTIKQNHRLVDTGPYQYLVHPSYTGLFLAYFGMAMFAGFRKEWVVIGMPVVIAVMYGRISNEEAVLRAEFPEFDDYLDKCVLQKIWSALVPDFDSWDGDTDEPQLLGRYTLSELEEKVEKLGIAELLRRKGLQYRITISAEDPMVHKFNIWMVSNGKESFTEDHLLVEVVLRRVRDIFSLKRNKLRGPENLLEMTEKCMKQLYAIENIDLIVIEWMKMQDPRPEAREQKQLETASASRALLPGQDYPGLGISKKFGAALIYLAQKAQRDAFINVPLYFHNAVFYHMNGYSFMNPVHEGLFRKVKNANNEVWFGAVLGGGVWVHVGEKKRRVRWKGEEMIQPISDRMKSYLLSSEYKAIVKLVESTPVQFHCEEGQIATEEEWLEAVNFFEVLAIQ